MDSVSGIFKSIFKPRCPYEARHFSVNNSELCGNEKHRLWPRKTEPSCIFSCFSPSPRGAYWQLHLFLNICGEIALQKKATAASRMTKSGLTYNVGCEKLMVTAPVTVYIYQAAQETAPVSKKLEAGKFSS